MHESGEEFSLGYPRRRPKELEERGCSGPPGSCELSVQAWRTLNSGSDDPPVKTCWLLFRWWAAVSTVLNEVTAGNARNGN